MKAFALLVLLAIVPNFAAAKKARDIADRPTTNEFSSGTVPADKDVGTDRWTEDDKTLRQEEETHGLRPKYTKENRKGTQKITEP